MKIDKDLFPGKQRKEIEQYEDKDPIIAIITPYYNTNKYIDTTANSVLNQTFPYFEWIIVDDGSTNKADIEKLDEIEKLDKRIKVYHKKNEGPAAARDFGVEKTSKSIKYLVFLDSDDLIVDTYLECAYWTLETNSKASWAYTDTINFDGQYYTWTKWYQPKKMMQDNILVMTAMIRKEAFLKVNGFEIRDKNVYEDWCLWLKMMKEGMFPVRMSFFGFWYRQKKKEESQLRQSNEDNREKAMKYVRDINKTIEQKEKREMFTLKKAIQYPKQDYNWDEMIENFAKIEIPQKAKNDKINILMIIPWMTMGGADKFNIDIINRSDKNKFHFIVVTTEPNRNEWRQQFEENAEVYDLTTFLDRKYWLSFINYLIQKNHIDLIFNTNSTFGYNILPYLKMTYPQIPILDYIHMEEWYNRNGGFSRDSSCVSSVIDKTYVCNQNSEKILVNHFKRKPEELGTVYIGVDEKVYDPDKFHKEDILKEKGITTNGKYIISYICRISEQKRPYLLLEIVYALKQKREDFIVIVAGDGPLLNKIKKEARKKKIHNHMIFLGSVKDTEKIYAISDVTINCSIKEGLALTAYESLSMGVPVVSCDVGGQKELINSEVGVIVPCLQKEEDIFDIHYKEEEIIPYVEGIDKVLNHLEDYKKQARKRILNGFTIDNMVENMEEIFVNLKNNPNQAKIENAKHLLPYADVTKELITKFFISEEAEYQWLSEDFNRQYVDIDWNLEKKEDKMLFYENTLEYKIKHPFYVILTKLHIYPFLKKILKRGE